MSFSSNTTLTIALAFLASCAATGSQGGSLGGGTERQGFYAKGFAGYGTLEDADVDSLQGGATTASSEGSFDAGPMFGVAAGYDFDDQWSLELEYAYRSNDLDEARTGSTVLGTDGDLASVAIMLNGFYKFDTDWALEPYVGFGFGLAQEIDMDLRGSNTGVDGSYSTESPAAQFMLGATRPVSDGIDLFVEGRFFRAFDPELGRESGNSNQGVRIETEYGNNALLFGAKFSL